MENSGNCQNLGINLQLIVSRLLLNQKLLKLLKFSDQDPLSHIDISQSEANEMKNTFIKITPSAGSLTTDTSSLVIIVKDGIINPDNSKYLTVSIVIGIYSPISQWIIKDSNLRPFAIMNEVSKTLNGVQIKGLGKLKFNEFDLAMLSNDENSCYNLYGEIILDA